MRANQLFLNEYASPEAAIARSRARWLVVHSAGDRIFYTEYNRRLVERLRAAGHPVAEAELVGPLGHLEGVVGMAKVADRIRALLAD